MSDPNQEPPRIGPKSLASESRQVYHPEHEDHEEHPDERWLVSYADMMTLLFGLFVLLFSMSTLDPKVAEQIKQSADQSFKSEEPVPPPPAAEPKIDTEALQIQITEQAARLQVLESDISTKELEIKRLEEELQQKSVAEKIVPPKSREPELEAQVQQLKEQLDKTIKDTQSLSAELAESKALNAKANDQQKIIELARNVSAENKALKSDLAELKAERAELERKVASVPAAPPKDNETQKLKAEIDKLNKDIAREKTASEQAQEKLKKELETLNGGRGQEFMAFFINWPTKDHDVDLVIQDPSGKIFDFKRREYKGHAGLFALDTRRGPGVELWQSKNIVPGRYKATYSLYNDYGNSEQAPVSAVILTPKGSFELPVAKLSTTGTRRVTAEFEIDKAGGVKIIKGK